MKTVTQEKGFTLVELAIVMVIIGLLIGGILKGQELIKNASISATAAQLKAFESAYVTFVDMYAGKPGDISNARNKIRGCNAANSCVNGDGNGFIWGTNSNNWGGAGFTDANNEKRQALKHLALADLIGGVNTAATTGADGWVQPKIGGFLVMGESYGNEVHHRGGGNTPAGIYVRQWRVATAGGTDVTTAAEIASLDRKIDDGVPSTGGLLLGGNDLCLDGRDYAMNLDEKRCSFMYKIR